GTPISREGEIKTRDGRVLGRHTGLPNYTIGQRKGLGIASPEPLYVIALDTANNALIVGTRDELGKSQLTATRVNWISGTPPSAPIRAEVKIRYKAQLVPAWITPLP
ncbi:MAG: tRNA 2-thiouridine(34) synthase MnmA, partial [Candidatus Thermofonsia Clade 1 bacterium]